MADKNNLLLQIVGRCVRRAGHTIISCSSPEEALARAGRVRRGENLLVVDLTSEEQSDVAFVLTACIPSLKVLFISELPVAKVEWKARRLVYAMAAHRRHVLRRPFTTRDLMVKIEHVLEAPGAKAQAAVQG